MSTIHEKWIHTTGCPWAFFSMEGCCGSLWLETYTRNLLICIHDTLEICSFVSAIHEKSAGLYLQYTRNLLVCIHDTREICSFVSAIHENQVCWFISAIHDNQICWFVSIMHEKWIYITDCQWSLFFFFFFISFFLFLFLFQYGGLLWISVAWNVHEKSAGLYLQYSRNLLVCIYNTREVC